MADNIGVAAFLGVIAWRLRRKLMQKFVSPPSQRPNVLVTGGAGYIGSHTLIILINAGYDVTVLDNLCNSSMESLTRVREITKCDPSRITFHNVDMLNVDAFEAVFKQSPTFHSCIHFAALKAVGESMRDPILYYENNVISMLNLLRLMQKYNCNKLIFSSSATVYGNAELPIKESSPTGCHITNAYGRTKYFIEEILQDFKTSLTTPFCITLLRYFNPIGAHPSGRIGEDPAGVPNNLMPFLLQVAIGRREQLTVFGNDFDTVDGTGVRDYIHVMDVASGHLSALQYMNKQSDGLFAFNLGTGSGVSVLQMLQAMEKVIGRPIPYGIGARRPGDIDVCYADVSRAKEVLGWKATHSLEEMCEGITLSNIRRAAYYEELYDCIKKCHLAGDHGKVKKTYTDVMKNYCNISREVVQIFVNLCTCQNQNKRAQRRKSVAVLSEGFNTRGIVQVLPMEKSDNHYHYILSYYDSYTKFIYLRPLVEKNVETITMILLEIFLMQGAPRLLQCSDMLISDVTQQLKALWPGCHILYSVGDIEDGMPTKILECLQQWMHSTRGTSWSHGLYFVAHQLNSAISGDLGTTPYYLQYGRHMTVGIADLQLPPGQFETFTTEEDLRQYFLSLQPTEIDLPPIKRMRQEDAISLITECDCNGTCDNCPCNATSADCPCSIMSGAGRLPVTSSNEV